MESNVLYSKRLLAPSYDVNVCAPVLLPVYVFDFSENLWPALLLGQWVGRQWISKVCTLQRNTWNEGKNHCQTLFSSSSGDFCCLKLTFWQTRSRYIQWYLRNSNRLVSKPISIQTKRLKCNLHNLHFRSVKFEIISWQTHFWNEAENTVCSRTQPKKVNGPKYCVCMKMVRT